jgi:cytochrome P450
LNGIVQMTLERHETTSSAFTWLVYLLAVNPDAQRRTRDEVRAALPINPASDSNIDVSQVLESLPYLNGVCSDTLRLYPTVPITLRVAVRDSNIMGTPVPQGTEITISAWAISRSSKIWGPDALDFNPKRWIDVDGEGNCKPNKKGGVDGNYGQLTFLHGPRSCIGQNFAKAELRCFIAAFVKAFKWELVGKAEDIVPFGAITIKPKSGLHFVEISSE